MMYCNVDSIGSIFMVFHTCNHYRYCMYMYIYTCMYSVQHVRLEYCTLYSLILQMCHVFNYSRSLGRESISENDVAMGRAVQPPAEPP